MSFSLIEIDPVYHVYSGQFSSFPEEIAVHGLSCRSGGVSEAPWASLDLGLHVGDDPAAVIANRRRYLAALGLDASQLVTPEQGGWPRRALVCGLHRADGCPDHG